MAYVYIHKKKDNDEIFYIGIGSDKNYKRANEKNGRNYLWKSITKKFDYEVSIIKDEISWEEACKLEIKLIKEYGKIIDKTGSLTNLTEGGEGFKKSHSEETKNKIRNTTKGKNYEERYGKELAEIILKKRSEFKINYWKSLDALQKKEIYKKISSKQKGTKKPQKLDKCPHCGVEGAQGLITRLHYNNCKLVTGVIKKLSEHHRNSLKGPRPNTKDLIWVNNGKINKRLRGEELKIALEDGWIIGMIRKYNN